MTTKIKHSNLTQPILGDFNTTSVDATVDVTSVDTFIYDTRKDSDGGAWRKRTQITSWYNETLNTATRGSRKEFPAVAVIVAETDKVTIYDGDDTAMPMWMVFSGGGIIYSNDASSIHMVNGLLCTGNGFATGVQLINFLSDSAKGYRTTTDTSYQGNWRSDLSGRNLSSTNWDGIAFSPTIVSGAVNDIAMTVLPNAPIDAATGLPVPTIAVATDGGVSVIKDNGTVVDISQPNSYTLAYEVAFTKDNKVAYIMDSDNSSRTMRVDSIPASDFVVTSNQLLQGSGEEFYGMSDFGSGLNLFLSKDNNSYIQDVVVANDNNRIIGCANNIAIVAPNIANPSKGSVAYITSDYNTGWMNGDIKLATLSDTDTTDAVDTNLIATSTLDSTDRLASHTYTSGSTTFSLTEDSNAGTSAGYVWILFNVPLGKSYAVSVQCDTAFTPDGQTRLVNVTTGVDVFPGQGTTDLRTLTFDHNDATGGVILYSSPVAGSTVAYTLSISEAEEDRSVNNSPIQVLGTITKTAVATGADLVCYSGFSTTDYLLQPYNSDLDVTDEMSVMFWVKDWTAGKDLLHRGPGSTRNSKTSFYLYCDGGYDYRLTLTSNGSSEQNFEIPLTENLIGWQNVCFTLKPGGTVEGYLNGQLLYSGAFTGTNVFSQATDQNGLYIGDGPVSGFSFDGSVALLRVSATAPTAEQIAKIYNDEKRLFQENAQATLYGTSNAVTALAYDDDTELLHAGTSSGRSVFQGLRRVDNTTTAVGVSISASNSMVLED